MLCWAGLGWAGLAWVMRAMHGAPEACLVGSAAAPATWPEPSRLRVLLLRCCGHPAHNPLPAQERLSGSGAAPMQAVPDMLEVGVGWGDMLSSTLSTLALQPFTSLCVRYARPGGVLVPVPGAAAVSLPEEPEARFRLHAPAAALHAALMLPSCFSF